MMNAILSRLMGRLRLKAGKRPLPVYAGCVILLISLYSIATQSNGPSYRSSSIRDLARRELALQPKVHLEDEFPRKIWQTWKVDPLGFEERDLTCARTWTQKNPDHRYEVLTDNNDMYYVETHFGPMGLNRPDIVYTYRELKAKIIKADLIRYLVMYIEGGIYADIDVEALRPVKRFIPDRYNLKDVKMVIGVEIDQPEYEDHPILGSKSKSFCQWTFMTKPGLPLMMDLINNIVQWLSDVAQEQKVPLGEIVLDFDQVISGTGPSAFTVAVLKHMSKRAGRQVTWNEFHAMSESKLVGDVLVLTVEAFAAGQGHSDSGNHNARTALVKHRYHASSWPTQHARYKHPVFGEVERCNWEADCVRAWDANKAAFENASPEEQLRQIAEKQAADAAEAEKEEALKKIGEIESANEARRKAEDEANLEKLGRIEKEQALEKLGGAVKQEKALERLGDAVKAPQRADSALPLVTGEDTSEEEMKAEVDNMLSRKKGPKKEVKQTSEPVEDGKEAGGDQKVLSESVDDKDDDTDRSTRAPIEEQTDEDDI